MSLTDTVIGVYDESQEVSAFIKEIRQELEILVMPSTQGLDLNQVVLDKELVLERSTCVIIVVNSIPSISILIGAIRKLLDEALKALYVISHADIKPLLDMTLIEDERTAAERLVAEGRIAWIQSFNKEELLTWLARYR
jgi:hypothetical protein